MKNISMFTAGIDIGDRFSEIRIVNDDGRVVDQSRIKTTQAAVTEYFGTRKSMRVVMEAGTHSPWMSRLVKKMGHDVLVSNPRKVGFIHNNPNKGDAVDAEMLARVGRFDPQLLFPLKHKDEGAQSYLAIAKARDALVRARTMLVNHVRGAVKAMGERLPCASASRFHKLEEKIPTSLSAALCPIMEQIATINSQITAFDRQIEQILKESFPKADVLRQIPGVGPITAFVFLLVIADVERFSRNRSVGHYLGLTPKRDQSGDNDPQLHITKAGNAYLRRLLITASHYILGQFGPDTDLRRLGMAIAQRGGKKAKRRAVVATARKLSVLMLSLLKSGEAYEPLRHANKANGVL